MTDVTEIKYQMVKVIRSERMKLVGYVTGIGEVQDTQYWLANNRRKSSCGRPSNK